jgi:EmrB/QacA subfamily drug resistance transporter
VVFATMAGVIAAMLLGALDSTIVGTAMPRVIAELNGFEHYAAVTTIYMLAATIVLPIVGKLSDIYGRKPFLLLGVGIFVVGSVLCGFAHSMEQLVAARGLQGLGGGCSQAMAFTTIADLFPPARRGRISGLMGAVFGLSSVIGPAVGGFLTDGPGWRWCFFVNIPVGAAAFAVLFFAFPYKKPSAAHKPSIDYLGALTLVCAAVPLLAALSLGGREWAWSSPQIVSMLIVGGVMAVVFWWIELRAKAPIMPPRLFKNPIVTTSAVAGMLVGVGMFGALLFIPLFLQGVVGTTATRSGTVVTPMMFAMILASMTSGQLITRLGRYKLVAVVGVVIVAIALGLLSTMGLETTYDGVLWRMIVMGIGLGLTMPVFNLAVQNAVDIKEVGVATSALQFLRSLGGLAGAAVFGAVMTNRFVAAFYAALPADVAAGVPPAVLAQFENPQMLMNPAAQKVLSDGALAPVLPTLLSTVKTALSSSLHVVFVVGAVIVAVAVVATVLLKDLPLRQSNRAPLPPTE